MTTFWRDVRYGVRTLLKSPGFTLAALLVLGLGISGTTAVFSILDGALLRPLPYEEPGRLLILYESNLKAGLNNMAVSIPDILDWQEQNRSFQAIAAYDTQKVGLEVGDRTETLSGAVVSSSLFGILGVEMAAGRAFTTAESLARERVAVLGNGLSRRLFGADAGVAVGKMVRADGQSYRVVGVTPPGFTFPTEAEIWMPLALDKNASRSNHFLYAVGRLASGVSRQQARADMQTVAARLAKQYPDTNAETGVVVKDLREHFLGDARFILWSLLATVVFVLLIACANIANLLLARAAAREREVAVRSALGSGRPRLIRQLLTESLILALLGGALGVLLARWELIAILRAIPIQLPIWIQIGINIRVLVFALFSSALTAAVFGLAPALRLSRTDLSLALKAGGGAPTPRQRVRGKLVVAEVALSAMLLICASLMATSLLRLQKVEPGFDPNGVMASEIGPLSDAEYSEEARVVSFFEQVNEKLGVIPGVESVGMSSQVPLWRRGGSEVGFSLEDQPAATKDRPYANFQVVDGDYFPALRIPLLEGRAFAPQDRADTSPVAIINRKMAKRYWPGQSPLGKRIKIPGSEMLQVVGVVGDVKHRGLGDEVMLDIYMPLRQRPRREMTFVVRGSAQPAALAPAIRNAVRAVDPQQPVISLMTMQEVATKSFWLQRFGADLMLVFALVALLLAAVGLYGNLSYLVTQRTRELGIQMALGADASDVLRSVLRQSLKLVLIGLAIGLPLSLLLNRVLASMLYGIHGFEISVVLGIGLLLLAVGLLASAVPARRATKVSPMVALRYE